MGMTHEDGDARQSMVESDKIQFWRETLDSASSPGVDSPIVFMARAPYGTIRFERKSRRFFGLALILRGEGPRRIALERVADKPWCLVR